MLTSGRLAMLFSRVSASFGSTSDPLRTASRAARVLYKCLGALASCSTSLLHDELATDGMATSCFQGSLQVTTCYQASYLRVLCHSVPWNGTLCRRGLAATNATTEFLCTAVASVPDDAWSASTLQDSQVTALQERAQTQPGGCCSATCRPGPHRFVNFCL
ncbi:hypothetical protein B0T25DRAFT_148081 [Lasiosphaeria hispida]|uniref:Uncharacterized protein n=1 Tax=Lasiosphaeria hispida TaxID=260671 RepID=A0AAJ0HLK1_9PEZI|nr:hypothetical protein B0T25DRAFT_148081 [Lasiosphaeria hispida]